MNLLPLLVALLVVATCLACCPSGAQEARITVHASHVLHRVTRTMTGACLEDVNHEVYGGLFSQMLFGESFQEPALPAPLTGFTPYGGDWSLEGDTVSVSASDGPRLMADIPALGDGEVGVEVLLPGAGPGVAGLVVRAGEQGVGADRFVGFEVSLDASRQVLVLGRHRHNWEPVRDVPCAVPADTWIPLVVRMEGNALEVTVGGRPVVRYVDEEHPLPPGGVGLRPFARAARFRNLWVKRDGHTTPLPFVAGPHPHAGVSGMWRAVRAGSAGGSFALIRTRPPVRPGLDPVETERQCQRIAFTQGAGEIGIENRGLNRWGLCVRRGKEYEGVVWARTDQPTDLYASLESADGTRRYAESRLRIRPGGWRRLTFRLRPDGDDNAARFALALRAPGVVDLAYAFLQPGRWGRYRGLPVRRDVVQGLIAQGITVLRYGGSMVNTDSYRWKQMIGPRDLRPPYRGFWYPYSSNGWGILDFLNLCEAIGIPGIPALNMGETPEDLADLVEYLNGPLDSEWGRRRAADGHPEPYHQRYLQLGNEEAVDEAYWQRFRPMAEAIWARDPQMILVVGDFAYGQPFEDPDRIEGAPRVRSLQAHRKILELARQHGREVWFDVHVWNHEPRDPEGLGGVPSFIRALQRLCPGARFQVAVFELNAVNHAVRRALANAHAINELERLGEWVPVVCSANCLQPYQQNDNGWDQGLLFLTPSQVWGQPPYYVTQMLSQNYLPQRVEAAVESPGGALDVTAKRSEDGKTLQLQVVNLDGAPVPAHIVLDGFVPARPTARVLELTGQLDDVNTPEEPNRIVPRSRAWRHGMQGGEAAYTFPPHSFTVMRFQ